MAYLEYALPAATAAGVSALLYRMLAPARVECWFCSSRQWVRRSEEDAFVCGSCGQYNGFAADGGYNKRIPEQHKITKNAPMYCTPRRPPASIRPNSRPDLLPAKADNGLCEKCNSAQELIRQRIANFDPVNEETWAEELEDYKHRLEKAYPLCERCVFTMRKKLDEDAKKYSYLAEARKAIVERMQKVVKPLLTRSRRRFFAGGSLTVMSQFTALVMSLLLAVTFFDRIQHHSPIFEPRTYLPLVDTVVDFVQEWSLVLSIAAGTIHLLGAYVSLARVNFCDLLFPVATGLLVVTTTLSSLAEDDRLLCQLSIASVMAILAFAIVAVPKKRKHRVRPNTIISSAFSVASTPVSQLSDSELSSIEGSVKSRVLWDRRNPELVSPPLVYKEQMNSSAHTESVYSIRHAQEAQPSSAFTQVRGGRKSRESTPADAAMDWEDSISELNYRAEQEREKHRRGGPNVLTRSTAVKELLKGGRGRASREATPMTASVVSTLSTLDIGGAGAEEMTNKNYRKGPFSTIGGRTAGPGFGAEGTKSTFGGGSIHSQPANTFAPRPPSTSFTVLSRKRYGNNFGGGSQSVYSHELGPGSSAASLVSVESARVIAEQRRWTQLLTAAVLVLVLLQAFQIYTNFQRD